MYTHIVTVFKDKRGKFRWNLKSKNQLIVADSAESYVQKSNARRAAMRLPIDYKKVKVVIE